MYTPIGVSIFYRNPKLETLSVNPNYYNPNPGHFQMLTTPNEVMVDNVVDEFRDVAEFMADVRG